MQNQAVGPSPPSGADVLNGWEPAPAAFFTRRASYPWIVIGTVCIGSFIGQLDASIVQLILPTLEHDFMARLGVVSWVAIAYQLAFAASLPVFARLVEIAGRKLLYLLGFALFGLFSLLCGFAADLPQLIALRALLGIGGALLGANAVVIVVRAAGADRQERALGIMAAAQAVGVSIGPVVGGVLLSALDWRWVFWVSVPFAIAGAALGWFVIPRSGERSPDRRFDWRGALLLVPALALMLLAITESVRWGPVSPAFLGSLALSIVLLAMFIRRERRAPAPLVNLALFRSIPFATGILGVVLSYGMLYAMLFLMSFAFIRGFHDTPLAAGLRLAIVPLGLGVVAPFAGWLQDRLGVRTVLISGMAVCIAGLLLLSEALTGAAGDLTGAMIGLGIYGAGLGLFIAPNNSATMSAAPRERSGQAGGLLNLLRVFFTLLGVAGAAALLSSRLAAKTGSGAQTLGVPETILFDGIEEVLLLLIAMAIVAGLASLLARVPPPAAATVS
jgi:EmrB/QacA subfamily drug resistance transporter